MEQTIRTIDDINKVLEVSTDEGEKLEAKCCLRRLIDKAEKQIRTAQKEINFGVREWTIEVLHHKYSYGLETDENEWFIPDYQRAFKWTNKQASRFIESILVGFPIPYLYVADIQDEDDELDGRVEIIDGSQRVRALHMFLTNEFKLSNLKELDVLEGFCFSDLSAGRQRRFMRESLRVVELIGDVNESSRRDLFERINSGSKPLIPTEQRHGSDDANTKFYRNVILRCANSSQFKELAPMTLKKVTSGDPKELVLRFFAYLNDYENYSGYVAPFLDAYLKKAAGEVDSGGLVIDDLNEEFDRVMSYIETYNPLGFRKSSASKSTQRARFEALAIGTALALREKPNLKAPASSFSEWAFDKEFQKIVSADSANNVRQLTRRIDFVKDKLLVG